MSTHDNQAPVIHLSPDGQQAEDTRDNAQPPSESKIMERSSPVSPSHWSKLGDHLATAGWFLLAWCLLGLFWEASAYFEWVNRRILPPPSETLPYLLSGPAPVGIGSQRTSYLGAILDTLGRVAIGFIGGMTAAIVLGALISRFRLMRRLAFPLVQTIAPISPVAWVPFAIAIVGIGGPAAVFVVFMAIFGSMTVSVVAAIDSTPREYLMVARNLGTRGPHLWTRVILPSAAPNLMVMARMSFFAAWMAVLAGEMAGINSGLGYLIMLGQQMYNMKLVMLGIITIGALGFAIDRLLLLAQRRLVWWETRP